MIVYAFYGLGKTTFVRKHANVAVDADEEYAMKREFPHNYRKSVYSYNDDNKIVFVNARNGVLDDSLISLAFIPENMDMIINRLRKRGVDESFIRELEVNSDEIMKELNARFPNAIVLKENEYINDYGGLILKMYKEENKIMKNGDLLVQFAVLWGMERAQSAIEEDGYAKLKVMREWCSDELFDLFTEWITEYLNQNEIEDSCDFFQIKLDKLLNKDIEEKKTILLDAMIIGAGGFTVRHGMSAPYTNEYMVKHDMFKNCYCAPVACNSNWMEKLPELLYAYLVDDKNWTDEQFADLKAETDKAWAEFPVDYHPDEYEPSDEYLHGRHIANGYERDGFANIVRGKCFGTYSSYTTSMQNELAKQLIVLKGFCPDVYLENGELSMSELSKVYARHGIDNDLSDMNEWCKRNPTRCSNLSQYYKGRQVE